MRNYFTFGGIDGRDLGIYISGEGVYNAPSRNYNAIAIPGRNGDLLGLERRFSNVEVKYPAFCYGDFADRIAAIREALLSLEGYQRLADTYNPEEYRMAYFEGGFEVEPTTVHDAGNFELTFTCKPQRYLVSGETAQAVASGDTLYNPTGFDALPVIHAVGYGTIEVGSQAIVVANTYPEVTINSEIADCYYDLQSANDAVSFSTNDFPVLHPGANGIAYSSTFTSVTVTPNWWRV